MIIVLSPGDQGIINTALNQSANSRLTYGATYVWGQRIPPLGRAENLFIIGHGLAGSNGTVAEVGNQRGDLAIDGQELWGNISSIFPMGYAGNIYVDACYSANYTTGNFSFIELLKNTASVTLRATGFYGRYGAVGGQIPAPGSGSWTQA